MKAETVQLKSMMSEMIQLQSATVVPVPEAVISNKSCVRQKALKSSKLVDHSDLIVAIAYA